MRTINFLKNLIYFIILSVILSSPAISITKGKVCDNPLKIPKDVSYRVVESSSLLDIKYSMVVRINRSVSKCVLRLIANKLTEKLRNKYERIFIAYLLPGMKDGHGAWATTHYNPNLQVNILGLSIKEKRDLLKKSKQLHKNLIGKWLDEVIAASSLREIYQVNGKIYLETTYHDGSGSKNELEEITKTSSKERKFRVKNNSSEEYFLIDSQGDLRLYDSEGFIRKAKAIK